MTDNVKAMLVGGPRSGQVVEIRWGDSYVVPVIQPVSQYTDADVRGIVDPETKAFYHPEVIKVHTMIVLCLVFQDLVGREREKLDALFSVILNDAAKSVIW